MSKKSKYPKVIADFYKKYAQLEKFDTIKIGAYEFVEPEVPEDFPISYCDQYLKDFNMKFVDLMHFTNEEDIQNFNKNFIPIIVGAKYAAGITVLVLGVFLNEEDKGFPVYIKGHNEEEFREFCDSLTNFTQTYLSNKRIAYLKKQITDK